MKLLTTLFALTILLSCSNTKETGKDKEPIKLVELNTNYEVKVGDLMKYSVSIHGSVGNQATVSVADSKIVVEKSADFEYDNPKKSKMSGGGGGVRTYTFEAIAEGVTTIKIQEEFRGEVTDTYELIINVTK